MICTGAAHIGDKNGVGFFHKKSKLERNKTMDVLIVEPEKVPRMASISGDLESLQKVVGGHIEAIYPFDDPVVLVCNEEGKLIGLPLNRNLEDYDIIAGTFMICGLGEEDFSSLSPELAEKFKEKFADPEVFIRMGNKIVSFPVKQKNELKKPKDRQKAQGCEL